MKQFINLLSCNNMHLDVIPNFLCTCSSAAAWQRGSVESAWSGIGWEGPSQVSWMHGEKVGLQVPGGGRQHKLSPKQCWWTCLTAASTGKKQPSMQMLSHLRYYCKLLWSSLCSDKISQTSNTSFHISCINKWELRKMVPCWTQGSHQCSSGWPK